MRISRGLTITSGVATLVAILLAAFYISLPKQSPLASADLMVAEISPNADGDADITEINYRLRRRANVSIYFIDDNGEHYYFRRNEPRIRGEYRVLFGGVVEGYIRENEQIKGEVLARLLADGTYTWVVEVEDSLTENIDSVQETGTLIVRDADAALPDLYDFTVSPKVFTPNQDGLSDQVYINVYTPKAADITIYLTGDDGRQYFVPESQEENLPGDPGRHTYIYDGGVGLGRNPPPDGRYKLQAIAEDEEGQRVSYNTEVTIELGGVPLAEIVGQPVGDTVNFTSEYVVLGDELYFELTVENYGDAPIRTTGPAPGYIYDQSDLYASTGYFQESGAWRVGIHCDTCETDYPWRWALGSETELTPIEVNGQTQFYLLPGERTVVMGGIRLTNIVESRNPQQFWAGLIHEDVEIAPANQRVDPHWIEIFDPDDVMIGSDGD